MVGYRYQCHQDFWWRWEWGSSLCPLISSIKKSLKLFGIRVLKWEKAMLIWFWLIRDLNIYITNLCGILCKFIYGGGVGWGGGDNSWRKKNYVNQLFMGN